MPPSKSRAAAMAVAATALLDGLTTQQRASTLFGFDDAERQTWFYTPTDHGGLPLAAMDTAQHRLVWQLVATGLSQPGYVTAATIVGLENVLDLIEGFGTNFARVRGRDPMLYWIAIFGTPGPQGAWAWRFAGHHVSLHFTVVDGQVVSATPCFFGADPANAPLLGPHMHRPLAGAEDLGRELARSLDESQRSTALVAPVAPDDIIGGNRSVLADGDTRIPLPSPLLWRETFEQEIVDLLDRVQKRVQESIGLTQDHLQQLAFTAKPKGLSASMLRTDQQEILRALLHTYIGRIADDLADAELAKLDGDSLNELHFLWAGSTEPGVPHYYRIQGLDLMVEYDNTTRDANHIHAVWRDLSRDFGRDPLAAHYADPGAHDHG